MNLARSRAPAKVRRPRREAPRVCSIVCAIVGLARAFGCGGKIALDVADRSTNPGEVAGDTGWGGLPRRAGAGSGAWGGNSGPWDGSPSPGGDGRAQGPWGPSGATAAGGERLDAEGGSWAGHAGTAAQAGTAAGHAGRPTGNDGSVTAYGGSPIDKDGSASASGGSPIGNDGSAVGCGGSPADSDGSMAGSGGSPAGDASLAGAGNSGAAAGGSFGQPLGGGGQGGMQNGSSPSCRSTATTACQAESCCAPLSVPGGAFWMGRSESGTDACPSKTTCFAEETPEHLAQIAPFVLDKYEVTVSRFRAFVQAYPSSRPAAGAGAHPRIPNSGWQSVWDDMLPPDLMELSKSVQCDRPTNTWSEQPSGDPEDYAVNCATWYEAFAFCIWDGGRLPTEAEWEYAAAGGEENRLYPWGSDAPASNLANRKGGGYTTKRPVGSTPDGNGRWGHADLAGSMWEWVLDGYDGDWYFAQEAGPSGNPCLDCANVGKTRYRSMRGGGNSDASDSYLRAAMRSCGLPTDRRAYVGWRCAREP